MSYIVHWTEVALNQLAAAWAAAADRAAITAAAHQLEQEIAADPHGRGIPRPGGSGYLAFEWPLTVEFEVIDADRTVRVALVWSLV